MRLMDRWVDSHELKSPKVLANTGVVSDANRCSSSVLSEFL